MRNFFGLACNYHRFDERFSIIAPPLTLLTQKHHEFVWSKGCEKSFQELKKTFKTATILTIPEKNKRFAFYCDASKQGLGTVLMQHGPITAHATQTNYSLCLSTTKRLRYPVHDLKPTSTNPRKLRANFVLFIYLLLLAVVQEETTLVKHQVLQQILSSMYYFEELRYNSKNRT